MQYEGGEKIEQQQKGWNKWGLARGQINTTEPVKSERMKWN